MGLGTMWVGADPADPTDPMAHGERSFKRVSVGQEW